MELLLFCLGVKYSPSNIYTQGKEHASEKLLHIGKEITTVVNCGLLQLLIEKSLFIQFYLKFEQEKFWSSGQKSKCYPEFLSKLFEE